MATNTCVWFEIPVTDLDRARAFYSTVLKRDLVQKVVPHGMV